MRRGRSDEGRQYSRNSEIRYLKQRPVGYFSSTHIERTPSLRNCEATLFYHLPSYILFLVRTLQKTSADVHSDYLAVLFCKAHYFTYC